MTLCILVKFLKVCREKILNKILTYGFSLYYRQNDKPNPLPKCNSDYLLMPAHKLAQLIRKREVIFIFILFFK